MILIEDPAWSGAIEAFRATGAHCVPIPVDADGLRVDLVRDRVSTEPVRLIYLSPTFHNPTGAVMSAERRSALAQLAAETGVMVVEDNALANLALTCNPPRPIAAFSNSRAILTLGSMSKLFWGGLRVGWVRAAPQIIAQLTHMKVTQDLVAL